MFEGINECLMDTNKPCVINSYKDNNNFILYINPTKNETLKEIFRQKSSITGHNLEIEFNYFNKDKNQIVSVEKIDEENCNCIKVVVNNQDPNNPEIFTLYPQNCENMFTKDNSPKSSFHSQNTYGNKYSKSSYRNNRYKKKNYYNKNSKSSSNYSRKLRHRNNGY